MLDTAEKQAAKQDDVITDQSDAAGEREKTADSAVEGERVRVVRSRPATADRRSLSWEGTGGGWGDGERREEGGGEGMRRPSLQSAEGAGIAVSHSEQKIKT